MTHSLHCSDPFKPDHRLALSSFLTGPEIFLDTKNSEIDSLSRTSLPIGK